MRRYESVVVISAELQESSIKTELTKIQNLLESNKAANINVDKWGTREVGIRNRKPLSGHYFCFQYECDNSAAQDVLTGALRINDAVLKFQTFRVQEKVRKVKARVRRNAAEGADGVEEADVSAA